MGETPDASDGDSASDPSKIAKVPHQPNKAGGAVEPSLKKVGWWKRGLRLLGLAQHQPDSLRLVTDAQSLRAWVDAHDAAASDSKLHFDQCKELLKLADEASDAKDVASGYEYLHIAEREAVFLMTKLELNVRAQSLRAEVRNSDKFGNSWRKEAILTLLGAACKDDSACAKTADKDPEILPEALAEAVEHRNTLLRNDHRKADKTRWQLSWLGFIVGLLVIAAFAFVIKWPLGDNPGGMNLLPYCIYLGLLGGFVSSAITQRTADRKTRVPELEVSFYAALARGVLGAATSIPVYILVKTGLITVGIAAEKSSTTWGLLFLCFFAGFSERWFLSSVTSVARDGKGEKTSEVGSQK